jgi:hypothetical protein
VNTANGDEVRSWIGIKLWASGVMSIDGNIGDTNLALVMLDHARDAVKRQRRPKDQGKLVIPDRDVQVPT